jgi:hypothetical protein
MLAGQKQPRICAAGKGARLASCLGRTFRLGEPGKLPVAVVSWALDQGVVVPSPWRIRITGVAAPLEPLFFARPNRGYVVPLDILLNDVSTFRAKTVWPNLG